MSTYLNHRSGTTVAGIVGTVLGMATLVVGFWVGSSYFEAQAFNRATGRNVTIIDAMFTRLVVQAQAK